MRLVFWALTYLAGLVIGHLGFYFAGYQLNTVETWLLSLAAWFNAQWVELLFWRRA